jgi:hypothetical protein
MSNHAARASENIQESEFRALENQQNKAILGKKSALLGLKRGNIRRFFAIDSSILTNVSY